MFKGMGLNVETLPGEKGWCAFQDPQEKRGGGEGVKSSAIA